MAQTRVLSKSAVTPSMQCNPSVRFYTVDIWMMGWGWMLVGGLQHLDLVVHASGVSDSLSLNWETTLSGSTNANPPPPPPLPPLLLPPSFPSILYPLPLSFRAMWKLPITRNTRSANAWTWTWNMQNTEVLNKGHTEMWLNASAGRKKAPSRSM